MKIARIALVSVAALTLAACSTPAEETPDTTTTAGAATAFDLAAVEVDPPVADLLPEDYADGIRVAMDIPYEPMEFLDENGELVGFDVDLANSIGAKFGVEMTLADQPFDSVIPSLQAGNHDIIIASMLVTPARVEAIDMIDYLRQGGQMLVPRGNPDDITQLSDLCGSTIAIQRGSAYVTTVGGYSTENCGDSPIVIEEYASSTDSQTALRAGRVAALVTNAIPADQVAKTAGDGEYFEVVQAEEAPQGYFAAGVGIGLLKEDADLRDAVQAALQSLMDDGTYELILEKWSLTDYAVDTAALNSVL